MKKVFSSNSELCHVYASQSQDEGRASHLSFRGPDLLSYDWWLISRFINDSTILFVNWSYSSATGRHINLARQAIGSHIEVISCSQPGNVDASIIDALRELEKVFNQFKTSRKYKLSLCHQSTAICRNIDRLILIWNDQTGLNYHDRYDNVINDINKYSLDRPEYYKEAAEQQHKLEDQRQAKMNYILSAIDHKVAKRKRLQIIGIMPYYYGSPGDIHMSDCEIYQKAINYCYQLKWQDRSELIDKILPRANFAYCRIKDNEVETTKGARVPVKDARILWAMIKAGRDIKGHRIGNYTVISLNGTLKIGCHVIPLDEVKRIGDLLDKMEDPGNE